MSDEDVSPKQSKSSPIAKTSSKLFFINRFKGKKQKADGASLTKPPQSQNSAPRTPELDPKVLTHSFFIILLFFPFIRINKFALSRPLLQYAPDTLGDEGFFDLLTRFQGNRMDDQRCSLQGGVSRGSSPSPCDTPPIAVRKRELAPPLYLDDLCRTGWDDL